MSRLQRPIKFNCIDNELWAFIEPLLPPPADKGRPRADDRTTINAILYVLKTGIPWNDLPEEYGDDVTAWRRLKEWEEKGVWKRVMDAMVAKGHSTGAVDMEALSRHRQRHHPCQKGGTLVGFDGHKRVEGTKVHAAVTEGSLPVGVMIGSAREHEGRKLIPPADGVHLHQARRRRRAGQAEEEAPYRLRGHQVWPPPE